MYFFYKTYILRIEWIKQLHRQTDGQMGRWMDSVIVLHRDRMSKVTLEREALYPIKPSKYSVCSLDLLSKYLLHAK